MTAPGTTAALICAMALGACQTTALQGGVTGPAPSQSASGSDRPADAAPGTCWDKYTSPAVIETVTEHVLVSPAKTNPDGSIRDLPVYRSSTHQAIVTPRGIRWFQTPCPDQMTSDRVASLQRALAARGLYRGAITGTLDGATRRAVRRLQKSEGLDSATLALETARKLGLIPYPRHPEAPS